MLFGPGPPSRWPQPRKIGLWAFAYQARLDSTMLLCCLFLFAVGAGAWSLDAWRAASSRPGNRARESWIPAMEICSRLSPGAAEWPVAAPTQGRAAGDQSGALS